MGRLTKMNSGHQDIKITPSGNFAVTIKSTFLGTFKTLEMALKVRNEHRIKHNLPDAKY